MGRLRNTRTKTKLKVQNQKTFFPTLRVTYPALTISPRALVAQLDRASDFEANATLQLLLDHQLHDGISGDRIQFI